MATIDQFKSFAPKKHELAHNTKAIIYTRVSTKEQADTNTSLATQKQYCEDYAKRNSLSIVKYFGGTYESAKTDERKEFKKMLKYVRQSGNIGFILVYSYDRFSRSGTAAAQISQELLSKGIKVIAVTQEVDTSTASGLFSQDLMLSFSRFDNELRRDKTVTAMKDLIKKGYWLWVPPLGYDNENKHQRAVDANYVINKDGELLRKAFKWKLKNIYTNVQIVEKLAKLGLKIDERRLHEAFKNPFYCGIIVSSMIPGEAFKGQHPPLISKEDFLTINAINKVHPTTHQTDNKHLPLKRFVYCESCQTPMTGYLVKKKKLYYYKCRTKRCRNNKSAKVLHDGFKNLLKCYEVDPKFSDILKEVMTYVFHNLAKDKQTEITVLKRELTGVKKKIETVEERYALGEIELPIYDKFKHKYEEEQSEIEQKIDSSGFSSSNLKKALNKVSKYSSNLSDMWDSANLVKKTQLQYLIFPEGMGYDKSNDKVRTPRVNLLFSVTSMITGVMKDYKKGEPVDFDKFSALVTAAGFKPATLRAEI